MTTRTSTTYNLILPAPPPPPSRLPPTSNLNLNINIPPITRKQHKALLVTDDYQRKYLSVKDFLTSGLPMSLASVGMICTLGYIMIVGIIIPEMVLGGDDDDNFKQAPSGR